jgi:hypothetical protein
MLIEGKGISNENTACRLRKDKEMINYQAIPQQEWTEKNFVVELEKKPTEELRRFLQGSWTASILSSEAIEELYRFQKQHQKEESLSQAVK